MIRAVRCALAWMVLAAAPSPARADPPRAYDAAQGVLGLFNAAQELPPFTPDQLAGRHVLLGDDPEAIAADAALNEWKVCVQDALVRWSSLKPGVGTLVDGAYGRCADHARDYRAHLMRISERGRAVVDVQMARGLTRLLEDQWRPRLIAAALDAELARQPAAAPSAPASAPPPR